MDSVQSLITNVDRVVDNLYNGNLSDVRAIFKALQGQEAAHLAAVVMAQLMDDDGSAMRTLINILGDE